MERGGTGDPFHLKIHAVSMLHQGGTGGTGFRGVRPRIYATVPFRLGYRHYSDLGTGMVLSSRRHEHDPIPTPRPQHPQPRSGTCGAPCPHPCLVRQPSPSCSASGPWTSTTITANRQLLLANLRLSAERLRHTLGRPAAKMTPAERSLWRVLAGSPRRPRR